MLNKLQLQNWHILHMKIFSCYSILYADLVKYLFNTVCSGYRAAKCLVRTCSRATDSSHYVRCSHVLTVM